MLPALREELALHAGPSAADGSPTWSLQDPVRNLYFRIDWLSFEMLSRWHLQDAQRIVQSITEDTPIDASAEDVEGLQRFLAENELLQRHDAQGSAWCHEQLAKRRSKLSHLLLHRYLFFRVPLWRPDAFLAATGGWVAPLYSRRFVWLTLAVLGVGLVEVSRQWDSFKATLVDTFSLAGLAAFLVTLVFVKFFHEMGHAWTAKRYGCRVPAMGVAFLVLFPMAYTDVNDAWKLPDRKRRLRIGAAGVSTELIIAVWALLAWALLPDGYLRTAAFLLATTTWVSTVIINASPFLRFDGYFLLMDWLDMPNLHQRAFALGKWRVRELLFGLGEAPPEHLSARRMRGLIGFAWLTWLYRLVVFVGIAILVYYLFPKPLGPFMAAVELGWFIFLPVWRELKEWHKSMDRILHARRPRMVLALLGIVLLLLALPWDGRIRSQGLLRPAEHFTLFAPGGAQLAQLPLRDGEAVVVGQVLVALDGSDLAYRHQVIASQLEVVRWQEGASSVDGSLQERSQVLTATRQRLQAELAGIDEELARYALKAPFDGVLRLTPDLRPGHWVAHNERLGVVSAPGQWQVETYLTESDLQRVAVGDQARFYSETAGRSVVALEVLRIDRDATRNLAEGILASTGGGAIAVRESELGQRTPDKAIYRVTLVAITPVADDVLQRGQVVIFGQPTSYLGKYVRSAAALIVREAGF